MKTTKHILQGIIITTLILASVYAASHFLHDLKSLYGELPAGSGKACFYDLMQ